MFIGHIADLLLAASPAGLFNRLVLSQRVTEVDTYLLIFGANLLRHPAGLAGNRVITADTQAGGGIIRSGILGPDAGDSQRESGKEEGGEVHLEVLFEIRIVQAKKAVEDRCRKKTS